MKRRILSMLLAGVLFTFTLAGCGNSDAGEDSLSEWGFDYEEIDEETMNEIIEKKNKDTEVQINPNGYTEAELEKQILPTVVSFVAKNGLGDGAFFNGNIYDIQEDYVYIITCQHGLCPGEYEEIFNSEHYGIQFAFATFFTEEKIKVSLDNIRLIENQDIALVAIETKDISKETLDVLKSINISNMYKKDLTENKVVGYAKINAGNFKKYEAVVESVMTYNIKVKDSTFVQGSSGGGVFDNNGNYCGFILSKPCLRYHNIIQPFYNSILEINPDY